MKRLALLMLLILVSLGIGITHIAEAGGGPYTTLTFPNANTRSCGSWQASGFGGQPTHDWFAVYYLTDGNGSLLSVGFLFHPQSVLTGTFFVRPHQNPIHFFATAYYRGTAYNIGNIYANNPCLYAPTPTFVPSLVPSLVPSRTFTPVPTIPPIRTLIPPQVTIGCDKTTIHGLVDQTLAPYVRATVNLASNLNITLATGIVAPTTSTYDIVLTYPTQPTATHLIVAVGQWDGSKYISPANLTGGDCIGAPQPTYTSTPTSTRTPVGTDTPPQVVIGCDKTTIHGVVTSILASTVRATVNLGANLNTILATGIVPLNGNTYDLTLTYPVQPTGTHLVVAVGQWDGTQYVHPANIIGGDCIGSVPPTTAATATSTNTPSPVNTPVNYHIEYFTADHTTIPAGGCVVLSYWVVGAQQITLQGSNWPTGPEILTDNPSQQTICPSAAGNYIPGQPVIYTLTVTYLNGKTESRALTIQVLPPAPSPTPSWTPSLVPTEVPTNPGAFDAPPTVIIGCSQTTIQVHGPKFNAPPAPFMRSQIVTGENTVLAVQDVSLPDNPPYTIVLTYPAQPVGSHLTVAMFLWNGTTTAGPAATYGGDCH